MLWPFATVVSQDAPRGVADKQDLVIFWLQAKRISAFSGKLLAGTALVITLSTCHGRLPNPPLSSWLSGIFRWRRAAHGVLADAYLQC